MENLSLYAPAPDLLSGGGLVAATPGIFAAAAAKQNRHSLVQETEKNNRTRQKKKKERNWRMKLRIHTNLDTRFQVGLPKDAYELLDLSFDNGQNRTLATCMVVLCSVFPI